MGRGMRIHAAQVYEGSNAEGPDDTCCAAALGEAQSGMQSLCCPEQPAHVL
jgi:hypothetical protein